MIIAVAEPLVAADPARPISPTAATAPTAPRAEPAGRIIIAAATIVDTPPVVVIGPERPVSPVTQYAAHRERVRRNRTKIAIVLLVAVIALAATLIWILQFGPIALGRRELVPAIDLTAHQRLARDTILSCATAQ